MRLSPGAGSVQRWLSGRPLPRPLTVHRWTLPIFRTTFHKLLIHSSLIDFWYNFRLSRGKFQFRVSAQMALLVVSAGPANGQCVPTEGVQVSPTAISVQRRGRQTERESGRPVSPRSSTPIAERTQKRRIYRWKFDHSGRASAPIPLKF